MKHFILNDKIQFSFSFNRDNLEEITTKLAEHLTVKIPNSKVLKKIEISYYNSSMSTHDCEPYYKNSKLTLIFSKRRFFGLLSAKIKIYLDSYNLFINENKVVNYCGDDSYEIVSLTKAELEYLCNMVKGFIKFYNKD